MKYCEFCGKELFDEAVMCPGCGKMLGEMPAASSKENEQSVSEPTVEKAEPTTATTEPYPAAKPVKAEKKPLSKKAKKIIVAVCIALAVIGALVATYFILDSYVWCDWYDDCYSFRLDGGNYCLEHTCEYKDCLRGKEASATKYCYYHACDVSGCDKVSLDGHKYCDYHRCDIEGCENSRDESSTAYCIDHLCQFDGCYNGVFSDGYKTCFDHKCKKTGCKEVMVAEGARYCDEHYGMRQLLGDPYMSFSLNSAGGIKFSFSATNNSNKTIKYVRFKAYLSNAVGDLITDDINGRSYVNVELTGPTSKGKKISMYSEIIGYCDRLDRIDITDITIVYTDGTAATGSYDYYIS